MFGLSLTVLVLSSLLSHTRAKSTIHVLHWNSTNPIFRIDNTDHIVDVNEGKCHISDSGHISQTKVPEVPMQFGKGTWGDFMILWTIYPPTNHLTFNFFIQH